MGAFKVFVICLVISTVSSQGRKYPIKLQPELDNIDVDDYLKNEKLVDLQIKCAVYDGPCDAVGRWIKPRIPAGLLGTCLKCTEKQAESLAKVLAFMQEKRPDDYRAGLEKYLKESGIAVPSSS